PEPHDQQLRAAVPRAVAPTGRARVTPPITLEPVRADQYQALADFNARFEDETRPVEFWLGRFRLWWDDNPAWDANATRGWTLMADGRIVGFVGVIPALFQTN